MILGHHEILKNLDELFPYDKPYKIGAASVDVRVGDSAIVESGGTIDIRHTTEESPYWLYPYDFLLVSMLEYTVVPAGLSCLFLLKSTSARSGLQHAFSGWIDPGWEGRLTMEISNSKRASSIPIWYGKPIGQLVYMQTEGSGIYNGRYQKDVSVQGPKEEKAYDAGSDEL